jgi:hypothetical protein
MPLIVRKNQFWTQGKKQKNHVLALFVKAFWPRYAPEILNTPIIPRCVQELLTCKLSPQPTYKVSALYPNESCANVCKAEFLSNSFNIANFTGVIKNC